MQHIEYGYYDIASNEAEVKENLLTASKYHPDSISIFPNYLRLAKSNLPDHQQLSCVIDYPFGLLDLKARLASVEFAIKNGANIIEAVAPSYFLCNRKYDKFREDIKNILELCQEHNVELRYILEYRVFTLDLLYKIVQILVGFGIKKMYPSTGYSLDDINDNLLASALINKKNVDIKIIANGNVWNDKQADLLCKSTELYGFKCHSINGLDRIYRCKQHSV